MSKSVSTDSSMGVPPGRPVRHAVDWAVEAGVADEVMAGARALVGRRRRRRAGIAGGVALVAIACGLWVLSVRRSARTGEVAATAVVDLPERRILSDGSVVELKDDSRIAVAFTPGFRRVALLSGEAHFKVAKNKERPFIVVIGDVEVRAVGTAFSVERGDASVEVLVTEGRVTLDKLPAAPAETRDASPQAAAPPRTIATLNAGNRAVIGIAEPTGAPPAVSVQQVSASEVSERLAWRIPRLEFTQTPLKEVISMINDHSQERLSLADASLENVRISGVLRADHIETLLRLLDDEHGIKAEHLADGRIVLGRSR